MAPVSGMNWPCAVLMNTLPDTGLTSSLWPSTGGGGAGAAAVVNVWSGPNVVPAALTATSRTWYSAPGISPVSGAVTVWVAGPSPPAAAASTGHRASWRRPGRAGSGRSRTRRTPGSASLGVDRARTMRRGGLAAHCSLEVPGRACRAGPAATVRCGANRVVDRRRGGLPVVAGRRDRVGVHAGGRGVQASGAVGSPVESVQDWIPGPPMPSASRSTRSSRAIWLIWWRVGIDDADRIMPGRAVGVRAADRIRRSHRQALTTADACPDRCCHRPSRPSASARAAVGSAAVGSRRPVCRPRLRSAGRSSKRLVAAAHAWLDAVACDDLEVDRAGGPRGW